MKPTFFATPVEFRAWLEANHATARELLVGFYKRGLGKRSISWPESVDEALCFGWIDGVRKSLSDEAYTIRFTPRRPTSIWSAINVAKVAALEELGRMTPAGRRAFAARRPERTGVYAFERSGDAELTPDEARTLRANAPAAAFFDAQAPGYRRTALHWVVSAKRAATRARRLDQLIADSAAGRKIGLLARPDASSRAANAPPKPRADEPRAGKQHADKSRADKPRADKSRADKPPARVTPPAPRGASSVKKARTGKATPPKATSSGAGKGSRRAKAASKGSRRAKVPLRASS